MPPRPVHPGEILKEELEVRGLSARRLAIELRVPANRITRILNGERPVSADTALRLARYFGTSAEVWVRLQASYDLRVVRGNRAHRSRAARGGVRQAAACA